MAEQEGIHEAAAPEVVWRGSWSEKTGKGINSWKNIREGGNAVFDKASFFYVLN
jgi:hypothetical protein